MRRGGGRAAGALALFALLTAGCTRRSTPSAPAVKSGQEAAEKADGAEAAPVVAIPGVATLRVVLAAPRFAEARAREQVRDWAGAAAAFDAAAFGAGHAAPSDPAEAQAIEYVGARLHLNAGDDAEAAVRFDRIGDADVRAPYARLRAAQAYARAGKADEAIARARQVPDGLPIAYDARAIEGEALAARGDRAAAVPLWRALLASQPHGPRWVDTAVKLASALVDGVDGDPAARAREAYDLVTRVAIEAPKLEVASGAAAVRDRAAALLAAHDASFVDALADVDRVRRAQAWLDTGEAARAIGDLVPITGPSGVARLKKAGTPGVLCKASILRAQATAKVRGATADAWGDAIGRCEGDDALVTALFAGGKASLAAKRADEALDRFGRVEQAFPRHRFADDARLYAATIARDRGDAARAEALLLALPQEYPEGDMRGEALFRVALARIARGDWAGARAPLDALAALDGVKHNAGTAGRAAYFRARASAMTGDAEDAQKRYAAILGDAPLSFYMTQAYARLAAIDPGAPARIVKEALAREPEGPLVTRDHEALRRPEFTRFVRLLDVGEIEEARREVTAAKLVEADADPEVVAVVAQLYDAAFAPDLGVALARTRLTDLAAHYPAGRYRALWEIAYPRAFEDLALRESQANALPPPLTWAIMREESSFVADAKSAANAFGLMQLVVPTARGLVRRTPPIGEADLQRPDLSIALGTKLLAGLRASFPANRALAIAAYNAGGGAVGRWVAARPSDDLDVWVEQIPYEETRAYVKRVMATEATYAFLYAPAALDDVLAVPRRVTP